MLIPYNSFDCHYTIILIHTFATMPHSMYVSLNTIWTVALLYVKTTPMWHLQYVWFRQAHVHLVGKGSLCQLHMSTLITRKREPARSFFLENLAPNILLLRPTCLCLGGKKLSYMFIQLLHIYKAVMVYFLRMLYFIFGDTFTSIKGILCQKTVH